MQRKYPILILILIIALVGVIARAQVQSTDVVLSVSPEHPAPNQNVSATINSHVINLDKANISWNVNNREMNGGVGKKSFSFKMGETGSPVVLSAVINTVDGQSISKTITLTPGDMDILFEAYDSYTPPFYKGKALVPSQGKFKIVSIPSVTSQKEQINMNNLSYTWIKDGKTQLDSSGWGKSYFIFQNSYLDKENVIEVKASDISGKSSAYGKIVLKPSNPKILFYENDPSLGIKWENSLTNGFAIGREGAIFIAEPYFFSPKNINSADLSFDWFLNKEKVETPSQKNALPIKPEPGQSGNAFIKILINNVNTLFQSMEKEINVSF